MVADCIAGKGKGVAAKKTLYKIYTEINNSYNFTVKYCVE